MKKLISLFILSILMISCGKKDEIIGSDSVYHLSSNWENQNGEKIKLAELKGKVVALVMIYTSCKTACPRLTAEMRNISKKVGEKNPEDIMYVLVSIDPENDTPEKMKEYLKNNQFTGKEWLFLRSDEESTREFANVLAIKYKEITPIDFSHSNIISIFGKNGSLAFQKEGLSVDVNGAVEEIKKQLN